MKPLHQVDEGESSPGPISNWRLENWQPVISDEAFAYLAVQRGKESDLRRDRSAWEAAYRRNLILLYDNIARYLPKYAVALDVGGGMSGISTLLFKHFGGSYWVAILDGEDEPPTMFAHDKPFSSNRVARAFLGDNGMPDDRFRSLADPEVRFNLVMSFQAWGFHFPPYKYLDFIAPRLNQNATIILDVRRSIPGWRGTLEKSFGKAEVIHEAPKFDRLVFHVA